MNIKTKKSTELVRDLVQKRHIARHLRELKAHDVDTYNHSIRVGMLVADVGYENDLPENEVRTLATAGLLHDLGKCDISPAIIEKKGPLNSAERREIDKHTLYGKRRINSSWLRRVREIVTHHHDCGSRAQRKNARTIRRRGGIPYYTEMVTAADIFDALAHDRPYKKKFSKSKVAREMEKTFCGDRRLIEQLLQRY